MTDVNPKRHRFRFSVRTLFMMVTFLGVGAGWATWQLNWIRQRHAFLDTLPIKLGGVVELGSDPTFHYSWVLKLFGEKPIVYLLDVKDECIGDAKSLFPEATINPPIDMSKL